MKPNKNLAALGIVLSKAPEPVGSYVAYKIINKLVYISGQISINPDNILIKGKIGKDLTLEEGQKASYYCCLNILSQLNAASKGDINKIKNCVKITGYVNSIDTSYDQAKIINPASELLVKIFENSGKHARAAISCNSLPLNAAVEIESIFEIN